MRLSKYYIVIFSNNVKKRIVGNSNIYKNIRKKYNNMLKKSTVIFPMKLLKKKNIRVELALLSTVATNVKDIERRDELGRMKKIVMGDNKYKILNISNYSIEEKIYDHQKNKHIYTEDLVDEYLSDNDFKQVFSLNNKIIIQKDEEFNLFSLKAKSESPRFLNCLEQYLFKLGRSNLLIVRDVSTTQRKDLYKMLVSKGYDINFLYRHYTY